MMKLRVIALALPLVFCGSASFAAAPTQNTISFHQALDVVEKAGYKNLHKIELEHHYYEVCAMNAEGKKVHFKIDAMTGAVLPAKEVKHHKSKKHAKHLKHHVKHAAETKTAETKAEPAKADEAAQ